MENNIIFIKEEKLEKKKKTENKIEKFFFFCFCYFTAPQYSGDLELRNNSWDSQKRPYRCGDLYEVYTN